MKPFLTVYGHVTVDQIATVARFPRVNETVDIIEKKTTLGGTGTNIAITAAKLGVPTALAAFIGQDFPEKFMNEIRSSGLITDEVVTVDDYETSSCTIVNTPEMEQKVVFYQGPQGFGTRIGRDLLRNASGSQWVHFCTGEPDWYLRLMGKLGGGNRISMDPSQETYRLWPEAKMRDGISMSDALFCNSYEAGVIEKRLGLESVFDVDLPLVVRTDGEKGSAAKVDGEILRVPCVKASGITDPTGCGDAYRAGFYSGLYHGYSVKDSLILASAVSSFVIEKTGALTNTPSWEQVEERAKTYMR